MQEQPPEHPNCFIIGCHTLLLGNCSREARPLHPLPGFCTGLPHLLPWAAQALTGKTNLEARALTAGQEAAGNMS